MSMLEGETDHSVQGADQNTTIDMYSIFCILNGKQFWVHTEANKCMLDKENLGRFLVEKQFREASLAYATRSSFLLFTSASSSFFGIRVEMCNL